MFPNPIPGLLKAVSKDQLAPPFADASSQTTFWKFRTPSKENVSVAAVAPARLTPREILSSGLSVSMRSWPPAMRMLPDAAPPPLASVIAPRDSLMSRLLVGCAGRVLLG